MIPLFPISYIFKTLSTLPHKLSMMGKSYYMLYDIKTILYVIEENFKNHIICFLIAKYFSYFVVIYPQ